MEFPGSVERQLEGTITVNIPISCGLCDPLVIISVVREGGRKLAVNTLIRYHPSLSYNFLRQGLCPRYSSRHF
jgi:hypothetical protein